MRKLFGGIAELMQRRDAGEDAPIVDAEALLDQGMLAVLGKDLGPEALAGFLRRAVAEVERAHGKLERLLDRPEEGRRVAHRLRGTAGSFGLALVSELAGMIEERARRGEGVADLVARLGEAVAATREEVGRARLA
jgi:HPt (histidine-containing phosphotransfer) domain-containing protein